MATIPEEPHTDLEQYLNRLATGEGEYPAEPHTNVEQYLNYMIENGLGGKSEIVTTLPAEGTDGAIYILVDDAEHPTKAYGVYTYAGGQYVLVAQPIDQSVKLVTELPETGEEGVLYYLEIDESGSTNTYDLYRWLNNGWIKVDSDIVLYSSTGQNVDGAMTQKAVTDAINGLPVKTLTTADYNWPTTGTKTAVALWLLDTGVYIAPASVVAKAHKYDDSRAGECLYIVRRRDTFNAEILCSSWVNGDWNVYHLIDGGAMSGGSASSTTLLCGSHTVNNLSNNSAYAPLSANQGKVLNEKIPIVLTGTEYNTLWENA